MAKRGGNRPSRVMMEAVNMVLDGDENGARGHLRELGDQKRDTEAKLNEFVKIRSEKGPYTFERKPRGSKRAAGTGDILNMLDGRIGTAKLVQIKLKVDELCTARKDEIDALAQKMEEVKRLEKAAADAQKKLKDAQTKLGL